MIGKSRGIAIAGWLVFLLILVPTSGAGAWGSWDYYDDCAYWGNCYDYYYDYYDYYGYDYGDYGYGYDYSYPSNYYYPSYQSYYPSTPSTYRSYSPTYYGGYDCSYPYFNCPQLGYGIVRSYPWGDYSRCYWPGYGYYSCYENPAQPLWDPYTGETY